MMPAVVAALIVAFLCFTSHFLRDERLPLWANSAISVIALVSIGALMGVQFGFSTGFWGDIFILVVYIFVLLKEFLDLLIYALAMGSPLARREGEALSVPVSASVAGVIGESVVVEPKG